MGGRQCEQMTVIHSAADAIFQICTLLLHSKSSRSQDPLLLFPPDVFIQCHIYGTETPPENSQGQSKIKGEQNKKIQKLSIKVAHTEEEKTRKLRLRLSKDI